MPSHFHSFFFLRPASQSFLPIAMHYPTSGAACTLYIKGICLLSQGMEYQLCFEFGRLINCLTLHTYTRLSCDIDPRQIQIDRVGSARRFAFRPLRIAWINTKFQYWIGFYANTNFVTIKKYALEGRRHSISNVILQRENITI